MDTQDQRVLIRTSVLIDAETDRSLRAMADAADRPLSREIRRALEEYVARNTQEHAA